MTNVREMWAIYDTVLIGPHLGSIVRGWFDSFSQLALVNEIPFFNVRNRSTAGVQYNNQDSAELLPYVFQAMSLGVEFLIFPFTDTCAVNDEPFLPFAKLAGEGPAPGTLLQNGGNEWIDDTKIQQQNEGEYEIFANLMDHAAVKLKISQDEKVCNVVTHQPAGFGTAGTAVSCGISEKFGIISNYTNGVPKIKNRYRFTTPIEFPRNVNFNAVITFSLYARYVLALMGGPETWANSLIPISDGDEPEHFSVAGHSVAGIRVSLLGVREVQQRGALHA